MKKFRDVEYVGWGFFLGASVVFAGPCIYLVWKVTTNLVSVGIRVGTGVLLAALVAGVVSWAANAVVQRRNEKKYIELRKAERKEAKRRKRTKRR